jgi:hypothetical protein
LPITVATGTSTPLISIGLGLGTVVNGSNIAVSIPVASTPPGIGTGATQGLNGSMYWDDTLGQLFIRYINGGAPAWVAAAPPAGGGSFLPLSGGTLTGGLNGTTAGFTGKVTSSSTLAADSATTLVTKDYVDSGVYSPRSYGNVSALGVLGSGSLNVASVTISSTGFFDITFTNPLPSASYVALSNLTSSGLDKSNVFNKTTTGFQVVVMNSSTGAYVNMPFNFIVFGG